MLSNSFIRTIIKNDTVTQSILFSWDISKILFIKLCFIYLIRISANGVYFVTFRCSDAGMEFFLTFSHGNLCYY